MEDQIKKITEDIRKEAENWVSYVDQTSDSVVKAIRGNSKDLTDALKKERRKIELRSEIGDHSRALTKAYTRLGEAYYDAVSAHREIGDVSDIMSLISTNKKLVELLSQQLEELEGGKKTNR